MNATEVVVAAIRRRQRGSDSRPVIVALDGYSGAGKSTLAASIADALGAGTVHTDDFYRDMPAVERLELSPAQGVDRYFDWERLRAEALLPIARGERARYRCFDWVGGSGVMSAVTVERHDVAVIEGVYSARPEFDDLVALKVLVETAAEERKRRREVRARTVSRDDPAGWDARWDAAEKLYFAAIRPRTAFDVIVSGNG
jgi:uridine kinase